MDEETLRRFVSPDGRIMTIPTKHSKRREFLDWLAQDFEPGVTFHEFAVDEILLRRHDDYPALRRYLVEMGFLTREENVYWRAGGTVLPEDRPGADAPGSSPSDPASGPVSPAS